MSDMKKTLANILGNKDIEQVKRKLGRSEKDFNVGAIQYEVIFFREFDPGSGRTLAACLTHASRTEVRC